MSSAGILRRTWNTRAWALLLALGVAFAAMSFVAPLVAPSVVEAQSATGTAAAEPSAADRQAAGQAYDRATAAYLARDYARAATLFETAYRLAPASAALLQAVRAHERAGNGLRAATLALRLQAFYGSDAAAARQAEQTLAATSSQFVRIDVTCQGSCTLELDGVLQEHTSFFAAPGAAHTVRATFDTGPVERAVTGAAGAVETISLEAPARVAQVDDTVGTGTGTGTGSESGTGTGTGAGSTGGGGGGGISPIPFVIAIIAAAGAGGVLIWSGIDTLAGVQPYRDMPTLERLHDGQSRELRTNILIGVTGALALTSLILAIVTDWDGEGESSEPAAGTPQVSFFASPEQAMLSLGGRF
ncbi:MAG: type IV secretion system protein [Sandaracinaceae bacterium]|nr:type IV secretion system protein [Sandaracinaceae bacterium]